MQSEYYAYLIATMSSLTFIINYCIVIWCGYKMCNFLKTYTCSIANGKKYCEIQTQMTKTLIAQGIVPLLTIMIPLLFLLICIFTPLEITPELSSVSGLVFGYLPTMNALSILIFVKPYRVHMISILKTGLQKFKANRIARVPTASELFVKKT